VRLNVVVVIEALCTKPTHHEFRISFFPAVQFTLAHVGVLRYRPAACKQALHLLKICLNRWQSISSYTSNFSVVLDICQTKSAFCL